MSDCFIFDHVRTPRGRGRADGALHEVAPVRLVSTVLQALKERVDLPTHLVDDVIMGCVEPVGEQGANIARLGVLCAGYAQSVAGIHVNRFCASALDAINMAAAQIMAGQTGLMVAGGVESMSRVGMGASAGAWSSDPSVAIQSYFTPQGIGADLIATKWGFSREMLDGFAARSHQRAARAWDEGRFEKSVVPVRDILGAVLLERDEHIRPTTTVQSLAKLKPAFERVGTEMGFDAVALQRYPEVDRIIHLHHAGNSSGICDGAGGVLLGTAEAGKAIGVRPRARIRSFAAVGSEPCIMLTAPEAATRKALARAGMDPKNVDLFEINEAFASVVLLYAELLGIDQERLNVNGGAIAMGHPLGASGAIILGIVLDELERRDLSTAVVTVCAGAGLGTATVIERM